MSTWMVVEDEPDIYDVLLAMFEIWGIEGIAFVDGAEAVAWVDDVDKGSVANELPELAILDIRLPEISGPEVGARIRRSGRLGQIAIVLITAYRLSADEEDHVKRIAQADMLMYKPLPPMPELRKTLDQIIASRKTRKPAAVTPVIGLAPVVPSPVAPTNSPVKSDSKKVDTPSVQGSAGISHAANLPGTPSTPPISSSAPGVPGTPGAPKSDAQPNPTPPKTSGN